MNQTLKKIISSPDFSQNIIVEKLLPASEGSFAPFPAGLDERIAEALRNRGINQIYTHQREVWESVKKGCHTVVVTPTASGKTLCYNLPALDALIRQADEANQNIAIAAANLRQARARIGTARAALLPGVGASAATTRSGADNRPVSSNFVYGTQAQWEISFWNALPNFEE